MPRRLHIAALAALVIAAAAVRAVDLFAPMRYDEAFSFLFYAQQRWQDALSDYSSPTNHLLYTGLVHGIWVGLGNEPWLFRLPAFLAGVALVPATYLAGRLLYSREAGLIAAALAVPAAWLAQYSVNGRGYMPGALFLLLGLCAGTWALRGGGARAWAATGASLVLAFYSAAFMALGVAMVALWLALEALLHERRGARLRALGVTLTGVAAASVALYAPTFGDGGWDYPFVEPLEKTGEQWDLLKELWGTWHEHVPWPVWIVIVAGFAAGLALHRRIARHRVPLIVPVVAGILGAMAVGPFAPFPKHWLFLLPLFLIVAGAGLAAIVRTEAAAVATAAVLAIAMATAYLAAGEDRLLVDHPMGAEDEARYVRDHHPGRPVVADRAAIVANYYFQRDDVPGLTQRVPGGADRALVLTRFDEDPLATVEDAGGHGSRPVLLERWRWVSLWDVRLLPRLRP